MATKKVRKEKQKPPIRFFAGGEMFHSCDYEGPGRVTTTYHNEELKQKVDAYMSVRLTEAARTIVAENPEAL